jgi:hypothetical protein
MVAPEMGEALEMNLSQARSLTPLKSPVEVALGIDATIQERLRLRSEEIHDQIQLWKIWDQFQSQIIHSESYSEINKERIPIQLGEGFLVQFKQ